MISLVFPFRLISKDNEKVFGRYSRRPFLSKKFKDFEKLVQITARQQYKGHPLNGHLKMTIVAEYTNKVHVDCFNSPKGIADALQGLAYENDRQIKVGHIAVAEGMPKDKFMVDIETVE